MNKTLEVMSSVLADHEWRMSILRRHALVGEYRQSRSYRDWDVAAKSVIDALIKLGWVAPESVEGYVLVPVEPTTEMLDAVTAADQGEPFSDRTITKIYQAMIAAGKKT